jgi:hypothetical protein
MGQVNGIKKIRSGFFRRFFPEVFSYQRQALSRLDLNLKDLAN